MSEVFSNSPFAGREMCDFCTAEPTRRFYACRDFVWLNHNMCAHQFIGAWAACAECARLVDGGSWSELTERALAQFRRIHGYSAYEEAHFRAQFREIHQLFKEHMVMEV